MFNWNEFTRLAKELAQNDSDEACLRTAASRGYYAAFHSARDKLKQLSISPPPKSGDLHVGIWNTYKQVPEVDFRKIGAWGKLILDLRTRADYEDTPTYLAKEVSLCIKTADQILELVQGLNQ